MQEPCCKLVVRSDFIAISERFKLQTISEYETVLVL